MILHSEPWFDGIRLEIVNGDDIMLSYKNNSKVSSCMSNEDRWKRTKFYSFVPKLTMLRAMYEDVLMLRTLLWEAVDINGIVTKTLDRIYAKSYPYDYCPTHLQQLSHPDILTQFETVWPKFAVVKKSGRRLRTNVTPHELNEYPSMDTFSWMATTKDALFNYYPEYTTVTRLTDHVYGRIYI